MPDVSLSAPGRIYGPNTDAGTRVGIVSTFEEAMRSLQSMQNWLREEQNKLELMGVLRSEITAFRNETAILHRRCHDMAQQVIRTAPKFAKTQIVGAGL